MISTFSSDRPIEKCADDRLGRTGFAEALARQIADTPSTESFVMGLVGPWGTGKTSLLNMISEVLQRRSDIVLVRFNPWLFSGTEQLIGHFFQELAAQLLEKPDHRLQTLAITLETYRQLLESLEPVPVVGAWAGRAVKLVKAIVRLLKRRSEALPQSVEGQRRKLDHVLRGLGKRLVVVIDDIDRLRRQEIQDLVRLVRLVADFPCTRYLLAFDRLRVERALAEAEDDGRAYLEKIIQVVHDVPVSRELDVARLLLSGLQQVTQDVRHGPFDPYEWQNVLNLVMRPLFGTVRDVQRYLNVLPATLEVIGDEVALVDVLALESIRVLLPDVFSLLAASPEALVMVNVLDHPGREYGDRMKSLWRSSSTPVVSTRRKCVSYARGCFPTAAATSTTLITVPSGSRSGGGAGVWRTRMCFASTWKRPCQWARCQLVTLRRPSALLLTRVHLLRCCSRRSQQRWSTYSNDCWTTKTSTRPPASREQSVC